jgi:hypothetical protein
MKFSRAFFIAVLVGFNVPYNTRIPNLLICSNEYNLADVNSE